jgi:hypothetical protein
VPKAALTALGNRTCRGVPDTALNCIVYLYPSRADAEAGKPLGGSGFMIGVQSEKYPNRSHMYVVTNRHVLEETGAWSDGSSTPKEKREIFRLFDSGTLSKCLTSP